jgi:hypothetical protein
MSMATKEITSYRADYYYRKGNSRTRTQIAGSVWQQLRGATTESAVIAYLRQRHLGYEIDLMRLEWQ